MVRKPRTKKVMKGNMRAAFKDLLHHEAELKLDQTYHNLKVLLPRDYLDYPDARDKDFFDKCDCSHLVDKFQYKHDFKSVDYVYHENYKLSGKLYNKFLLENKHWEMKGVTVKQAAEVTYHKNEVKKHWLIMKRKMGLALVKGIPEDKIGKQE